MKKALSPLWLFLSALIVQFGSVTSSLANDGHVGEIRYSMLSEDQFRRLYGTEWEILRGQAVPQDSELRDYWVSENLPDARGVFLRSANHGRPRHEGNPEGTLPIGTYRGDSFKSHSHDDKGHGHGHDFHIPTTHGIGGSAPGRGAGHGWHTEGLRGSIHTGHAQIEPTGDAETRPRNITVNTFVKMRESAPVVQKAPISAEWVTRLFESPEFLRALREAITTTARSFF